MESEPLQERPVTPIGQDCGRAERAAFMENCPYELRESLGDAAMAIHHGEALSINIRSEEHTSELQSPCNLVCRLLLEKKKCKTSRNGRALSRIAIRIESKNANGKDD